MGSGGGTEWGANTLTSVVKLSGKAALFDLINTCGLRCRTLINSCDFSIQLISLWPCTASVSVVGTRSSVNSLTAPMGEDVLSETILFWIFLTRRFAAFTARRVVIASLDCKYFLRQLNILVQACTFVAAVKINRLHSAIHNSLNLSRSKFASVILLSMKLRQQQDVSHVPSKACRHRLRRRVHRRSKFCRS